ncbi:hypothetical protein GWI33_003316 [Rhynchophorus ferrugineus]|uniref:Uncharacterized protein n=1 Tax=Rhynchophorus ferrugineus TaxID=354439 RepID=A0A834MJ48_RHYFE|nr:hypothetical protein GWI33_003316 [Rhynchophorus ferrugineus]
MPGVGRGDNWGATTAREKGGHPAMKYGAQVPFQEKPYLSSSFLIRQPIDEQTVLHSGWRKDKDGEAPE